MTDDKQRLIDHVKEIASTLTEGDLGLNDDGEEQTAFDYIADCYDIEHRIGTDKAYRSSKICVAFGGPNIWIDTGSLRVIGAWWGDYHEVSFVDNIGLSEALEELYNC